MSLILESITFGLIVVFIILGIVGIIVPLIPGIILIYLAVLTYVFAYGIETIGWATFAIITLIALVAGTSDLWMSYWGAKTGGASGRALLYGTVGAIVGSFFAPLIGTLIGYAAGLLLGEYQKQGDWALAWKASAGGLAGWGVATAVQMAGGLVILGLFLWQVLFT